MTTWKRLPASVAVDLAAGASVDLAKKGFPAVLSGREVRVYWSSEDRRLSFRVVTETEVLLSPGVTAEFSEVLDTLAEPEPPRVSAAFSVKVGQA